MPTTSANERAEDLLHYLPIIVRASGISDADRVFCASIVRRMKATGRVDLSRKQAFVVKRIVGKFRDQTLRGDAPCA